MIYRFLKRFDRAYSKAVLIKPGGPNLLSRDEECTLRSAMYDLKVREMLWETYHRG